jgi:hypothetical protein
MDVKYRAYFFILFCPYEQQGSSEETLGREVSPKSR